MDPTRIQALAAPETATATKHHPARVEYRWTLTARAGPSRGRSIVSASSPPTHRTAQTRCTARELTAVSWLAAPAAWPCRDRGRIARMLSAARATMPERRRTTAAPAVTTIAIAELIAATRVKSSWKRNVWNWLPNVGSLSGVPARSANENTSPTNPATTHTTPETQA